MQRPALRLRDLPRQPSTPAGPTLPQQLASAQAALETQREQAHKSLQDLVDQLTTERAAHLRTGAELSGLQEQLTAAQAQHQQDLAHLADARSALQNVTSERDALLAANPKDIPPAEQQPTPATH